LAGACLAVAFLHSTTALSADQPGYRDGVLTIPRVDTPEKVGQYQDVTFQSATDGTWRLTAGQIVETPKLVRVHIDQTKVIKSDTFPVSVHLRVRGQQGGCDYVGAGRIHQRINETNFDVGVSVVPSDDAANGLIACTANYRVFRMTIPLEVYGLSAGTYTYNVNGITGSFTLDSDNKFSDDCDATATGSCTSNTGNL
jgi:hypothetical protein